jgi:hypothetical protein
VWAAFDLSPPTPSTRLAAVFLRMRFDDPRVIAVNLEIHGEHLGIAGEGMAATPLAEAALAGDTPGMVERLRYTGPVSCSGIGESAFGWFFGGFETDISVPWHYLVHALVEVPHDLSEVTGTVRADVSMAQGCYRARLHHARSDEACSFALRLPPGRPTVTRRSGHATAVVAQTAADPARHSSAVRLCLAADIEKFSRFRNPEAARAQRRFVHVLEAARKYAEVREEHVELQQSGDGQLSILPPTIDESLVIPRLADGLKLALSEVNRDLNAHARIRIRVALHRGHIVPGANGWIGDSAIAVHRLMDSAAARQALAGHPEADFVLIVPDTLYRDIIAHRYGHLAPEDFEPVEAKVPEKDFAEHAWVYVPSAGRPSPPA